MIRNISDKPKFFLESVLPYAQFDLQEIVVKNFDRQGTEFFSERLDHSSVYLHGNQMMGDPGKIFCQRAPARTDLYENIVVGKMQCSNNVPCDVVIDKKILTERLLGFVRSVMN